MVNKKNISLLFLAVLHIGSGYGAPHGDLNLSHKTGNLFYETKAIVAMDVLSVFYGIVFGGYQLARFIKETLPFKRKLILTGYSDKDLLVGPLNNFCRTCLEEQSSTNVIKLYEYLIPENLSAEQASEYRKKTLFFYNMYQFPVFREMIKKWPEYPEYIIRLHDHLKYSKVYRKIINNVQGFKKGELADYIKAEYKRIVPPSIINEEALSE